MNEHINKLYEIAKKPQRRIIGLMSGTSMDGLDIALCEIGGSGTDTTVKVLNFETAGYTAAFREDVKQVFSRRDADLQQVCLMNAVIGRVHAKCVLEVLKKWDVDPGSVDLIASHGQTVFHAPRSLHKLEGYPDATLQIGDGDHVSVGTGIITLSDFRQKHIAAGGEGAPLAVYGDYLLFGGKPNDTILLNIGGIANFTWLPAGDDPGQIFSTDVGPGNTMMDRYMQDEFGKFFDEHATVAVSGTPDQALLSTLLENDFFAKPFPKTTGPELFNRSYLEQAQQRSGTTSLAQADVMATLCHFSASAIIDAIKRSVKPGAQAVIYLSGGGMHNPLLVSLLKAGLPDAEFSTTDTLGILPDAKEAVLFAVLANEAVAGKPIDLGNRKGIPAVTMGKVSFPS